ncbi:mycoredoxin [Corynebacterium halotolerans]|uniref:Glutaredoxin n=1 Tax=Corynebacterium halotolerans YIM 70093 = DSM 44683 TaxID=1121362 RepID=M1NQP8_9CORY|nr:mycoredoxin [Corynebacterium halotolerans]AGF71842.1 glutaredoxin [Corynebacterium halotolerans YIM 70093 = DSM 44683]
MAENTENTGNTTEQQHVTIYVTDWCPFCKNLRKRLDRTETPYTLIDVEADDEAAAWVESVNDGNRVVPTVRYSDGSHATNPEASAVRRKLEELTA